MIISWTFLAPLVAGGISARALLDAWRRWRRGGATLTEALEEVGIAGLLLGIAAGSMKHPLLAGAFVVLMGSAEVASVVTARRLRSRADVDRLEAPRQAGEE